jgi:uncharacterized GH25 family protein
MIRCLTFALLLLETVTHAQAHFVFVVPGKSGESATVVFSEDLNPDENVDVTTIGSSKLLVRNAVGQDTPLELQKADHAFHVNLGSEKTSIVVHGTCEYGVMTRGDSKPFLLVYHPKTILGAALDPKSDLGEAAIVELVPRGKPGAMTFQLMAKGKPVADAEVTVIEPEGTQKKVKTDANGQTPTFQPVGKYGVWARYLVREAGEHNGKAYEEIRHYPTLVVDVTAESKGSSQVSQLPSMPLATSSFGAVACDGWLYIYGGHIARTHSYSTEAVSGRFHRLKLADGKTWEELSGGPGLQGMNLATHGGKIYRVGGMQPRNKPGDEVDNYSIADCTCFDPAAGNWKSIGSLPEPRSSHDVAVVDDKLFVVGGWNMKGEAGGNDWLKTMLVMDLAADNPEWKSVEQPFQRRALIVAVRHGKIYVLGGFDEADEPSLRVEIYDPNTSNWTTGPDLPGHKMNGFAPAACTMNDQLYVSVGDGTMYRLNDTENRWDEVARTTPRIVHRLAPHESQILVIGGASKGDNLSLIEAVTVEGNGNL